MKKSMLSFLTFPYKVVPLQKVVQPEKDLLACMPTWVENVWQEIPKIAHEKDI